MGAILKLTATAYLLVGLGINLSLVSLGLPENQNRAYGKSYERPTFVQIIIPQIVAQDPPPPDKPRPDGGSEGAGGRCVIEIVDLAV
jgi:hypothetical protein